MTTTTVPAQNHTVEAGTAPALVRLAELGVAIRRRELTAEEQRAGTRAVLDWFGATLAGSTMAPAKILAEALAAESGSGSSRLVRSGIRFPARTAALINGTASHTAELDDIYREGIYHPGSPTVASALALAEQVDASGADLVRAVVVGYELGDRIAETVNPSHYRFWHTTGTVGTIGAAAAGAALLDLDATRFAHALATATTTAAGLQQAFRADAMSKPMHAGHAAEAGATAALAASHGFTGALDVLDGSAGFGPAMAASPDWAKATGSPTRQLAIERPTVKNHSCCGHTFAAVDAALELRTDGVRAEDVESIEVRTYTTATKVAGIAEPHSEFEAKFSTAYCVAAALVLGSVRLRAFTAEALADPQIRRIAARTTLVADEEMEAAFPGQRRASLVITDQAGARHTAARETRKGDPDDPLTDAELADKFDDLATPVLGREGARDLADALWGLWSDTTRVRDLPLAAKA